MDFCTEPADAMRPAPFLAVIPLAVAALPVHAGESKSPFYQYLETLPALSADMRAAFDKARSMYRTDCKCLRFMMDGEIRQIALPLDDAVRRLLMRGIGTGYVRPCGPKECESS